MRLKVLLSCLLAVGIAAVLYIEQRIWPPVVDPEQQFLLQLEKTHQQFLLQLEKTHTLREQQQLYEQYYPFCCNCAALNGKPCVRGRYLSPVMPGLPGKPDAPELRLPACICPDYFSKDGPKFLPMAPLPPDPARQALLQQREQEQLQNQERLREERVLRLQQLKGEFCSNPSNIQKCMQIGNDRLCCGN